VTILTLFEKILDGKGTKADYDQLESACQTVKTMSRCGLGQTAANPILTTMASFPQYFEARLKPEDYIPAFDLDAALKEGCAITGRQPHHEE
jgi:[NiFe] hydrogenase diaphorase moiety large subunit